MGLPSRHSGAVGAPQPNARPGASTFTGLVARNCLGSRDGKQLRILNHDPIFKGRTVWNCRTVPPERAVPLRFWLRRVRVQSAKAILDMPRHGARLYCDAWLQGNGNGVRSTPYSVLIPQKEKRPLPRGLSHAQPHAPNSPQCLSPHGRPGHAQPHTPPRNWSANDVPCPPSRRRNHHRRASSTVRRNSMNDKAS